LRDLHVNQASGHGRYPGQNTGVPSVITTGLIASCVALFLCFLASVFGMRADGGWLTLPPDYTQFGWIARVLGGALGLTVFVYLLLIHHRYNNPYRRRKRKRSHTGLLLRVSLAISVACIIWEIALLALVMLLALVVAYGLFADDGF